MVPIHNSPERLPSSPTHHWTPRRTLSVHVNQGSGGFPADVHCASFEIKCHEEYLGQLYALLYHSEAIKIKLFYGTKKNFAKIFQSLLKKYFSLTFSLCQKKVSENNIFFQVIEKF